MSEPSTPSASIQGRIRQLLEREPRYGRYADLEARTGVKADTWKAVVLGRQRPTVEVIGALLTEWPQLATWILMGNPDCRQLGLDDLTREGLMYGTTSYADKIVQVAVDVRQNGHVDVHARAGDSDLLHWHPTEVVYMQTEVSDGEARIDVLTPASAPATFVAIGAWLQLLEGRCRRSATIAFSKSYGIDQKPQAVAQVLSEFNLRVQNENDSSKMVLGQLSQVQIAGPLQILQFRPGEHYSKYRDNADRLFGPVGK